MNTTNLEDANRARTTQANASTGLPKALGRRQILVVDDEADIRELLKFNLEKEGYRVETVEDGQKALEFIQKNPVDLVLLDLMLPGLPGLEFCKQLKRKSDFESIPIIMISAKSAETDVIVGLELGADDYITKPFSVREVIARIKAIFRRIEEKKVPETPTELRFQDLIMDLSRYQVKVEGKETKLTTTEFKILQCLMTRLGHVFSRDELIEFALGKNISVMDRTIDVHITNLRKKIGRYSVNIESIRSVGYRLNDAIISAVV